MTASLIPAQDLVPSLPSRVVNIDVVDMLEGGPAPAGDTVAFILPHDLHIKADDKIVRRGTKTITLDQGKGAIRLPVYDTTAAPGDWWITVKKSWEDCAYKIRVPAGTGPINLVDINPIQTLTGRELQYAITGVGVTVTEAPQAGGTVTFNAGQLDFAIQVPSFKPETIYPYIDSTVKTSTAAESTKIRGEVATDLTAYKASIQSLLQGVATAYDLAKQLGFAGTMAQWLASLKGDKGDVGATPELSFTVATGAPGSSATVAVTGTPENPKLALTIPQGIKGDKGDVGQGLTLLGTKESQAGLPAPAASKAGDGYMIGSHLWVYTGTAWVDAGEIKGPPGDTPVISTTAKTLAPDASATAVTTGTPTAPSIEIGVPRGRDGKTISKVEQKNASEFTVTVKDPETGTDTGTNLTLPTGMTGFAEVRSGVWAPTNVPPASGSPGLPELYAGDFYGPAQDRIVASLEQTRIPRALGDALQGQLDKGVGIVWAGSSTANGGVASDDSRRLVQRVAALMGPRPVISAVSASDKTPADGVQVWQYSQGGTTADDYLTDAKVAAIGSIKPVLMIHMVGSNDYANQWGAESIYTNSKRWLNKIRAVSPDTMHAYISHQARNDINKQPTVRYWQYTEQLRRLQAEDPTHVTVVDFARRWYKMGVPGGNHWGLVSGDSMHLADEGNRILANWVAEWLGLPTPAGAEVFSTPSFAGGDLTGGNEIARIAIPARPFPRNLQVVGNVYANARNGAFADVIVAIGPDNWIQAAHLSTSPQSYSIAMSYPCKPYVAPNAVLSASADCYVSANVRYMKFHVEAVPA